ncbi:MAG: hypothetical protein WB787_05070, partial [Candidatus Acidiferrales bacterium]
MLPIHISPERIEDAYRVAPEIILCATGIFVMLLDPFLRATWKRALGWISFAGAVGALASLY